MTRHQPTLGQDRKKGSNLIDILIRIGGEVVIALVPGFKAQERNVLGMIRESSVHTITTLPLLLPFPLLPLAGAIYRLLPTGLLGVVFMAITVPWTS